MRPTAEFDPPRARQAALRWLARREYSRYELYERLVRKGCIEAVAAQVAADLEAENLLSDDRFVEALVRARRTRGFGPIRIRRELEEKGVALETIDQWLDVNSREWIEDLKHLWHKKFGDDRALDYAERAKQVRFLQYRGFTFDQIQQVLHPPE